MSDYLYIPNILKDIRPNIDLPLSEQSTECRFGALLEMVIHLATS